MTVRLTRSGYQTAQRRVTLTAARNAQTIDASLERSKRASDDSGPVRFSGSVLFDTHPSGVSVYLDNKLVGVTPLRLADVRAGSHVVRMEKTGFKRWTASVSVVAGQRTRVAASLEEDLGR
jgi:CRISPR/Cas system-associated exonuclease Cas4 (RecB family)